MASNLHYWCHNWYLVMWCMHASFHAHRPANLYILLCNYVQCVALRLRSSPRVQYVRRFIVPCSVLVYFFCQCSSEWQMMGSGSKVSSNRWRSSASWSCRSRACTWTRVSPPSRTRCSKWRAASTFLQSSAHSGCCFLYQRHTKYVTTPDNFLTPTSLFGR